MKRAVDLTEAEKASLGNQLVRLGDMMGDGLHHEPDGKWISREYKKVAKRLGYGTARKSRGPAINKAMVAALAAASCTKCGAELKQTRSGACRAECVSCGARFQFKVKRA